MEQKREDFVLLNDGCEKEEEGSCYSWPMTWYMHNWPRTEECKNDWPETTI